MPEFARFYNPASQRISKDWQLQFLAAGVGSAPVDLLKLSTATRNTDSGETGL
jgi:hypothetical protein